MDRTRKWTYVAQEARRLAELGLSPVEIAKRLGVNHSTVHRWMVAGKLRDTRRTNPVRPAVEPSPVVASTPATVWASAVRQAYALDATDDQLVDLAQAALTVAKDADESTPVRLAAMGRFQALVKQLALVAREPEDDRLAPTSTPATPVPPPKRTDPRGQWMTLQ